MLLVLADGPLHGYGVMQRVEEDSGIRMGPGTIYGTLQRLEESGLVHDAGEDPSDARRRSTFELTERGRTTLRKEVDRIQRLAELTRPLAGEEG